MKKKLEHIWYYYKWYILAAALVILVAANFIGELGQRRQPDGVVSIVTTSQVPEETVEKIRALFETLWGDRNQDGITEVEVNVYAYDGGLIPAAAPGRLRRRGRASGLGDPGGDYGSVSFGRGRTDAAGRAPAILWRVPGV